jgi:hypothetical protein
LRGDGRRRNGQGLPPDSAAIPQPDFVTSAETPGVMEQRIPSCHQRPQIEWEGGALVAFCAHRACAIR